MAQMLHEWAMHDLGHIRQIAELVRARKHLAGAGKLGKFLPIEAMIIRLAGGTSHAPGGITPPANRPVPERTRPGKWTGIAAVE